MRAALVPGGRFAAQCGGAGNIARLRQISTEVEAAEPFAPHFEGFAEPWNYARRRGDRGATPCGWLRRGPLLAAALDDRATASQPSSSAPSVSAPSWTACRPSSREPFVAAILEAEPEPLRLEYVRLNIEAVAA